MNHAVLIYLPEMEFDLMVELSAKLEAAMTNAGTGELDGNEIGGGETVLLMYGADAELLFRSIEPVLQEEKTAIGARAVLRWVSMVHRNAR